MVQPIEHLHAASAGSDQVRLHVALADGSGGRLMLFLHGFPEFWQAWHRQLEHFGNDYQAAAMDLRGYNLSDKPKGTRHYALPRLAADVAGVIRLLSPLRPAVLVGHDWGGILAWYVARKLPELVSHLVVINAPHPALFAREVARSPLQLLSSSYAALFMVPGFSELILRAGRCALLRRMVFGLCARPEAFSADLRQAYLDAWRQPGALRGGLSYYRSLENVRLLFRDSPHWRIPIPTLMLWGDRDPALRTGNLDGLEQFVPGVTIRRHPEATHWVVHEHPEWVHTHMRDFLAAARG